MSGKNVIGNEGSDAQQRERANFEEGGIAEVDAVAERERNLRPTVEMEVQARVDTNHPDSGVEGLTLAAEERLQAREAEIGRTRTRWDRRADSDRERRSREVVSRKSHERRLTVQRRAASVDPWADPDRSDSREELSRTELAAVNEQAGRLAECLGGWSRAAISRRLAQRVVDGADLQSAVVATSEEFRTAPGQVIPIDAIERVDRREVSVAGEVDVLWEPSHPRISQVGLIADETGRTKFTVWKRSRQPWMEEGERVKIYEAAKSWYQGRCSIALTGRSRVAFPERDR